MTNDFGGSELGFCIFSMDITKDSLQTFKEVISGQFLNFHGTKLIADALLLYNMGTDVKANFG